MKVLTPLRIAAVLGSLLALLLIVDFLALVAGADSRTMRARVSAG